MIDNQIAFEYHAVRLRGGIMGQLARKTLTVRSTLEVNTQVEAVAWYLNLPSATFPNYAGKEDLNSRLPELQKVGLLHWPHDIVTTTMGHDAD